MGAFPDKEVDFIITWGFPDPTPWSLSKVIASQWYKCLDASLTEHCLVSLGRARWSGIIWYWAMGVLLWVSWIGV